jgi:hypothetical protein
MNSARALPIGDRFKRYIGSFVIVPLKNGTYGYGRVREYLLFSFYDLNTKEPVHDLDKIAARPILFSVGVHKSALKKWKVIGKRPLEESLRRGIKRFLQDIADPSKCTIADEDGNERPATPSECIGLERSAVWEDNHVEDRLLDTFMGRPNPVYERLKVKLR